MFKRSHHRSVTSRVTPAGVLASSRRCAGAGLIGSLVIIVLAAAISAGVVVGIFYWQQAGSHSMSPEEIEAYMQQQEQQMPTAPQFTLVDADGQRFSSDQLEGKIWIADFGFTRCKGICPAMTRSMEDVIETLKLTPFWNEIEIVRFSVDPEYDKPSVLREYLKKRGIDEPKWHWLTGDKQKIWNISEKGFKLPVGDNPGNEAMPVSHSSKFALVGPDGKIQGYYSALDGEEQAEMLLAIEKLANHSRTP